MEFVPVKISNPITFEEAKEGHYRLWDYLAKTGYGNKPDYVREEILNGCYACEYVVDRFFDFGSCSVCPVFNEFCGTRGSLYYRWCNSSDREERKVLAAKIRDLPWVDKKGSFDPE